MVIFQSNVNVVLSTIYNFLGSFYCVFTHKDLWKYGQILTIQKSLAIKQLRFSKKIFFIQVYHLIYGVPIKNLECESI